MKIAITGHRPHKLGNDYNLTSPLIMWVKQQIISIINHFGKDIADAEYSKLELITGMALGIDQLFAKIAIKLNIPFIATIPFKGQELAWPKKSQDVYHDLLKQASKIVVVDMTNEEDETVILEHITGYTPYDMYKNMPVTQYNFLKMQTRNIWMVDNCDLLIAVWNKSSGGTANCIRYASSKTPGVDVIQINPHDFCKQSNKEEIDKQIPY